MQKSSHTKTAEVWTAPRLTRLGTIGEVAGPTGTVTQNPSGNKS